MTLQSATISRVRKPVMSITYQAPYRAHSRDANVLVLLAPSIPVRQWARKHSRTAEAAHALLRTLYRSPQMPRAG